MNNITVIPQQIISPNKTLNFNAYVLHIEGDSTKGQRQARIGVPVLSDKGVEIDRVVVFIKPADFNAFWSTFTSDKQIVDLVLKSQGLKSDYTNFDDSIVNVVPSK